MCVVYFYALIKNHWLLPQRIFRVEQDRFDATYMIQHHNYFYASQKHQKQYLVFQHEVHFLFLSYAASSQLEYMLAKRKYYLLVGAARSTEGFVILSVGIFQSLQHSIICHCVDLYHQE